VSDPTNRSPGDEATFNAADRDRDPNQARPSDGSDAETARSSPGGFAPPKTFMRYADVESHSPRRLLNLFPDSALEPERPTTSDATIAPRPPQQAQWTARQSGSRPTSRAAPPEASAPFAARQAPVDPHDPYPSASYNAAKREVLTAIGAQCPVALITAPAGMGKTTLCRALARELDGQAASSLIVDAPQLFDVLLRTMLESFGVLANEPAAAANQPRAALVGALDAFLESLTHLHASAVVFIDEAEKLAADVLLDLAQVQAPGRPGARVLQLVLVGRPALETQLKQVDLREVDGRIGCRVVLGPLNRDEISGYLARRLALAGGRARIEFAAPAAALVYERSAGVPSLVNELCDRALRLAREEASPLVTEALVAAAVGIDPAARRPHAFAWLVGAAVALLVLAGAGGALWLWRDAVNRAVLRWEHVPALPGSPPGILPAPIEPVTPPR
jgi:type II secretory pathway predicted ATPase ExeA